MWGTTSNNSKLVFIKMTTATVPNVGLNECDNNGEEKTMPIEEQQVRPNDGENMVNIDSEKLFRLKTSIWFWI